MLKSKKIKLVKCIRIANALSLCPAETGPEKKNAHEQEDNSTTVLLKAGRE